MINIAIPIPTNFSPDTEIKITKTDKGQVIYVQILGKDGSPLNLTDASKIELIFGHKTDNSVADVTIIATKVDANNGFIFIVTNANFQTTGEWNIFVTVYWNVSSDFPNGREITSHNCSPDYITVVEK